MTSSTPALGERSPRPSSRRARWAIAGLVATGLVLYFLPTIMVRMFPSQGARIWLSRDFSGQVEVGDASLRWQRPVRLADVTVTSPEGKSVAKVAAVTSQRSLWDLIIQPQQPLELDLEGFELSLIVTDPQPPRGPLDLSLLADALQSFHVPRPLRSMVARIANGRIDICNEAGEIIDTWTPLEVVYRYDTSPQPQQTISISLPASAEGDRPTLAATGRWAQLPASPRSEELTFQIEGSNVSLAPVRPWLDRSLGNDRFLDRLSGRIVGEFHRQVRDGWQLTLWAQLNGRSAVHEEQSRFPPGQEIAFLDPDGTQVDVEIEGAYSRPDDQLLIPKLTVSADETIITAQGQVTELSGPEVVDVRAKVQSPGMALINLLPESLRNRVQVTGPRFSEISVRGPLLPWKHDEGSGLEISMIVEWERAEAYGLTSENGRMRLTLRGGRLVAEPIDVPIGVGRLRQLPALDVTQDPPVLEFPDGVMLDNVALTEEVCRDWLKYVSPTLANASAVEGRFSVTTNGGTLPVGRPEQGKLQGTLTIHQARVRPGPLAEEMLVPVNRLQGIMAGGNESDLSQQSWLTAADEPVAFQLQGGRVWHDGFAFLIRDVPLDTSGFVGLDESLDLTMTMPIPDRWLANAGPILRSLQGEQVQLAVGGMLNHPEIDAAPLAEFGKRVGIKAGAGLIERIIERRRDRRR